MDKSLTIDKYKKEKESAENRITETINTVLINFEQETGLVITDISLYFSLEEKIPEIFSTTVHTNLTLSTTNKGD